MTFIRELTAALLAGLCGYLLGFDEELILISIIWTLIVFEGIQVLHGYLFKE